MSRPLRPALPLLAAALLAAPGGASAQEVKASQTGGVTQTVHTTVVTLGYDRPVARGRTIFGDILDWETVWTPGANRATWIEFSEPVTVQGAELPAGRYGLWTVPHESAPWEIVFVSDWDTHHSYFPFESEVARVRARAERGEHMEVLAFYFPEVGPYETTLRFHWGEIVVPLRIAVPR